MCVRSECVAAEIFPPSGKQLFERDRNLDTSDIQFLEDGNSLLSPSEAFILSAAAGNVADVGIETQTCFLLQPETTWRWTSRSSRTSRTWI